MPPGGPGFGRNFEIREKLKEPKPKNLKEVPGYVYRNITKFFSRLFYIFKLVWATSPWILFAMMFFAVLTGVIPVIQAKISASVLNELAQDYALASQGLGDYQTMYMNALKLLIWQFAFIFITSIVNNLKNLETRVAGELVVNHVNIMIMKKAKTVDLASYDRPEFYEKLENASREAGNRPIQILQSSFSIVSTIISLVSYIIILWAINPVAPWIIIAVSIPTAIISFVYRRKNFIYIVHRSKDRRILSYYKDIMTNKDMVKEIRMYGLSDEFIDRYDKTFKRYYKGLRKIFVGEGIWNISISVLSSVVNCILFLFIANGVIKGETQVGDYSLYTGALLSIANLVHAFITTTATIFEGTLFIDNLILFMNEKTTIVPSLDKPVSPVHHTGHTFELRNVSFRYPGTDRDVIKNVSCKFEKGETIVLVGLNGAGKTTLIKLITRLYDPTEGEILLDGKNIKEYNVEELYSLFGIIFQDFGKYAATVKENIAFSDINNPIDDEKVVKSAKESAADEYIMRLNKQYDTPLMRYFEDDGIEPSIGQWQKLSVARAFYSDSDILILDEPTASLDAIAEQEIYNQFDNLRHNKTTIFVSHRLSSATKADKILVLEQGELIEEGNHSELMHKKGRYYELFTTQASRYITLDESLNGKINE